VRRLPALLVALAVTALLAGCGESGTSAGATVSVYASVPLRGPEVAAGNELCAGAKRALAAAGGRAGDLRVRLTCLDVSGPAGPWTLARVGANARRAVEDSSTVAYLGEPDPHARRQSAPILEAAEIAEIPPTTSTNSGESTMHQLLRLIAENSGTPRESIFESFSGS
jgi:hypothetical protein